MLDRYDREETIDPLFGATVKYCQNMTRGSDGGIPYDAFNDCIPTYDKTYEKERNNIIKNNTKKYLHIHKHIL